MALSHALDVVGLVKRDQLKRKKRMTRKLITGGHFAQIDETEINSKRMYALTTSLLKDITYYGSMVFAEIAFENLLHIETLEHGEQDGELLAL